MLLSRPLEQSRDWEIMPRDRINAIGRDTMRYALIIAAAATASLLAITSSASARLGMAPLAVQNDGVVQVKHGHGHGHGHRGWHRNRGHHYGWSRGHHRGWGHRHHRYY
jgi:hypothetical protein